MSNSGSLGLKILLVLFLFIGFSFIIMEQRLESKNLDIKIAGLQKSIEAVSIQKREVNAGIESELARLSSYDYYNLGQPISMKDIIYVPLKYSSDIAAKTENPTSYYKSSASGIVDRIIESFIPR